MGTARKEPAKFRITADIDRHRFKKRLRDALVTSKNEFHDVISEAFADEVRISLEKLRASGKILNFKIKPYSYPNRKIHSLRNAVESKEGYTFWYFRIEISTNLKTKISEAQIVPPRVLKWQPFTYGAGFQKYFKFKAVKQKTQNRFEIEFLELKLPPSILKAVLDLTSKRCDCDRSKLRAVITGPWDWHIHFICAGCGTKYLCECFRKAFEKKAAEDERWKAEQPADHKRIYEAQGWPTAVNREAIEGAKYRPKICHLCTNTPSNLSYSSRMYGSDVKAKYGPYIMRNVVEKGINEREAEDQIRVHLGLPKIGEGWVSETELFNIVKGLFEPDHKVFREASPKWLGRLRLDIFVPSLNLAIEYHGQQHFQPVERFGGAEAFQRGVLRDKMKRNLCKKNGIQLIHFKYSDLISEENVRRKILGKVPAARLQKNKKR